MKGGWNVLEWNEGKKTLDSTCYAPASNGVVIAVLCSCTALYGKLEFVEREDLSNWNKNISFPCPIKEVALIGQYLSVYCLSVPESGDQDMIMLNESISYLKENSDWSELALFLSRECSWWYDLAAITFLSFLWSCGLEAVKMVCKWFVNPFKLFCSISPFYFHTQWFLVQLSCLTERQADSQTPSVSQFLW